MNTKGIGIIGMAILLVALVVLGLLGYHFYKVITEEKKPEAIAPPVEKIMDIELPLKVELRNVFNGTPVPNINLMIFYNGLRETGTTNSDGVYTSTMYVRPNRKVTVLAYTTGVRQWVSKIIEGYTKDKLEVMLEKVYRVKMNFKPLGEFSISVLDPSYTAISSGGTYNVTTSGNDKPSFTVMLKNTKDNSGLPLYGEGKDPETGRTYISALVITIQGEGVIVTNAELVYSEASKKIYVITLDKDVLDRVVDSAGNVVEGKEGLYSLILETDASALSSGSSVTVTIELVTCLDLEYLKTHSGVKNPEAYVTTSFTFNIGA